MDAQSDLVGKLLVAMPGMGDPRFAHAVIVMCQHTRDHAMGLIVNKPKLGVTLGAVLERLGLVARPLAAARPVLEGGPVAKERGFVLHSLDYAPEDGVQPVTDAIALTATQDILESIARTPVPERYLLALGCSSWGPGQIESELRLNAWLVVDCDEDIVFGDDHEEKWAKAIRRLGFDPSQLMGAAGNA